MTVDSAIEIAYWLIVPGVPLTFVGFCAWILLTHRWEQIRILTVNPCPHCGTAFGRKIARRSVSGKYDDRHGSSKPPRSMDGPITEIHVCIRRVPCPNCGEVSFWYPATLKLSATSNVILGIPESPRPLPGVINEGREPSKN